LHKFPAKKTGSPKNKEERNKEASDKQKKPQNGVWSKWEVKKRALKKVKMKGEGGETKLTNPRGFWFGGLFGTVGARERGGGELKSPGRPPVKRDPEDN